MLSRSGRKRDRRPAAPAARAAAVAARERCGARSRIPTRPYARLVRDAGRAGAHESLRGGGRDDPPLSRATRSRRAGRSSGRKRGRYTGRRAVPESGARDATVEAVLAGRHTRVLLAGPGQPRGTVRLRERAPTSTWPARRAATSYRAARRGGRRRGAQDRCRPTPQSGSPSAAGRLDCAARLARGAQALIAAAQLSGARTPKSRSRGAPAAPAERGGAR